MERISSSSARAAGFTLCSAMVATLLAGCAGQPSIASAGGAPVTNGRVDAPNGANVDKALAKAEARVAKSPDNVAARGELAQLYLAAGRFDAAATTLEDAVALGDQSPRTGLSLALAYIGTSREAPALEVLSRWQGRIPAGDLGLAVALAGQPAQGVTILTDALRGGDNTAKVRQNLAYAYALDGRWAEARIIAGQDVPADQLDARMGEWASRARPDQSQVRVAGLLGAPVRSDPGQPAALALNGIDRAPRMAIAEARPVAGELAALEPVAEALPAAPVEEQPTSAIAAAPVLAQQVSPVRQEVAPASRPAPKPARTSIERAFDTFARAEQPRGKGAGHVVQLGSFSTAEGARRAWKIFQRRDPSLRDHTLRITEAQVHGRRYFRVAAVGFDRHAAQDLCSTVKQRGGQCFARAEDRPLPGAVAARRAAVASR